MTDNIIQFNRARVRRMSTNDKRVHPRIESDDRLFAQVVLAADDPDLVGSTLSCTAVNMSVGGIQFKTTEAVPVGTLLDLWVDVASRPGKFFLAGEVRWSRPTQESDANGTELYFIGVQLKSGAATDILDWRDFHSSAFAR
jgi:Tfp pilus assembly protein PilZ